MRSTARFGAGRLAHDATCGPDVDGAKAKHHALLGAHAGELRDSAGSADCHAGVHTNDEAADECEAHTHLQPKVLVDAHTEQGAAQRKLLMQR